MNKTIALLLASIIIISTIISFIPKVSSQRYYIPYNDPYFVGARYSMPESRPPSATYVTADIFIPDGPPEHNSFLNNYIHYYILLNVNNYDPNNAPRYWYQLGIDNRFHVVAATYDRGNDRRPLTGDDNVWWCISPNDPNPIYFLNRGEWYRFRIEMVGRTVVFSVQRFINGVWQNVFEPCRQSYSTSAYLVLDRSYSVFQEVRANQTYEKLPYYSFHFTNLGNSRRSIETNWVSFKGSYNDRVNPVPPNTQATIYQNHVLIQNFYNRWEIYSYYRIQDGASATWTPQKNTFLIAFRTASNWIEIGKVTYADYKPDSLNKYWIQYEHVTTVGEKTLRPPSIVYNPHTGKYYLAWLGTDNRLNVIQSYDGRTWFNKVTLNEYSYHGPTIVVGDDRYIYLLWVGMDNRINIIRSLDGIGWFDKSTSSEKTDRHIGAAYVPGTQSSLIISWVGLDYRINIIKYYPEGKIWWGKMTLNIYSRSGLSMTYIREPYTKGSYSLYLVFSGWDNRLYSIRSSDTLGTNWGYLMSFDEVRATNPFIASNQDKLFITYSLWSYHLFLLRTTL